MVDFVSLRFGDWPQEDRLAWEAATRPVRPWEDEPRRPWSAKTVATNRKNYGRWLGWLRAEGLLNAGDPVGRITEDAVLGYGGRLRGRAAPRTAHSYLVGLKVVAKRFAPGRDWRWLDDICNRARKWSSAQPKRERPYLPLTDLHHALLERLEQTAAEAKFDTNGAILRRDLMIVLILSATALRLGNCAALDIGGVLKRERNFWAVRIPAVETKTGKPINQILSSDVGSWVDWYLDTVRVSFPNAQTEASMWMSRRGTRLSHHSIYVAVKTRCQDLVGVGLCPHAIRTLCNDALCGEMLGDEPLGKIMLNHSDARTSERHYRGSDGLLESREINRAIDAIRNTRGGF